MIDWSVGKRVDLRTRFSFEFSIAQCGSNKIQSPSGKEFDVRLAGTRSGKGAKVRSLFASGTRASIGRIVGRKRVDCDRSLEIETRYVEGLVGRKSGSFFVRVFDQFVRRHGNAAMRSPFATRLVLRSVGELEKIRM